jgi:hypothetical protein
MTECIQDYNKVVWILLISHPIEGMCEQSRTSIRAAFDASSQQMFLGQKLQGPLLDLNFVIAMRQK